MKTLIIDNYDSYTYNLVQLVDEVMQEKSIVIKNDELTFENLKKLNFDNIIIGPGPGRPDNDKDFGICKDVILHINKPILGVCLGQQGIFYLYGGKLDYNTPTHGIISNIYHNNKGIFKDIPNGFKATRYHSLICVNTFVKDINVDAKTEDGIIMGISHKNKPIYAVQFHPESITTEYGNKIIENFYNITKQFYQENSPLYYKKINKLYNDVEVYNKLYNIDNKLVWLDSSQIKDGYSRFSIFGLSNKNDFYLKYDVNNNKTTKSYLNGKEEIYNQSILDYLKENKIIYKTIDKLPFDFQLGYIGYFGYELKNDTISKNKHYYKYPDAYFKYVSRAIILDFKDKCTYILCTKDDIQFIEKAPKLLESKNITPYYPKENNNKFPKIKFAQDKDEYISNIKKAKEYIKKGESYEVCLTNRIDIKANINPSKYYNILRNVSPAPYSCLLNFDEFSIASSSMERFIKFDRNNNIIAKPIKGTIKRGKDKNEDQKLINKLKDDQKTKAENLMIVDLLRNDLGKICKTSSVKVPKLMDVETYTTLHQLVSTITGVLDNKYDNIDIIKATFPGGSMTGSPKKRTIEIIDKLENICRGVYSGCIGYISNTQAMDFNIVIRTAVIEKDLTTIGVGGAIIDLSDPLEEWDEIILKAKGALTALKLYYEKLHYKFNLSD